MLIEYSSFIELFSSSLKNKQRSFSHSWNFIARFIRTYAFEGFDEHGCAAEVGGTHVYEK